MKLHVSSIFLLLSFSLFAQHKYEWRTTPGIPPYNLEKVKSLIKRIDVNRKDYYGHTRLNESSYDSLSLREKFTYNMIHAESYRQNCSFISEEAHPDKIFATLINSLGQLDYYWSDRQYDFFEHNRDSVIFLIKESSTTSKFIGINYKHVLIDVNAKELIPFIIDTYNIDRKDSDLLTVLALLMKNNKYAAFIQTSIYDQLYGKEANRSSDIPFNTANAQVIISNAADFYKNLK